MAIPSKITLKNLVEMEAFAGLLIKNIPAPPVLGLIGSLGVGKTTLTNFMLKALGNTKPVASPTYIWLKSYNINKLGWRRVHHIDTYRLAKPDPELASAISDCQQDAQAITIIEWADRIHSLLVSGSTLLHFNLDQQKNRRLTITRLSK